MCFCHYSLLNSASTVQANIVTDGRLRLETQEPRVPESFLSIKHPGAGFHSHELLCLDSHSSYLLVVYMYDICIIYIYIYVSIYVSSYVLSWSWDWPFTAAAAAGARKRSVCHIS